MEIEIEDKSYLVTNLIWGDIYEDYGNNCEGKKLGKLVDGKPQWF